RKDGTYVQSYDRAAPGAASASYPTSTPSTLGPGATPNLSTQTSVYAPTTSSTLPRTPVSVTSSAPKYTAAAPDPATTYHVHGYYRSDGTYVQEYVRSAPGTADTVVATATMRTPVPDPRSEERRVGKAWGDRVASA